VKNKNIRIIARLDMKGENVVKGINLEGIRPIGKPESMAKEYYLNGIDEIIYMDVVASLYERNSLSNYIKQAASNIFVPLTVGGGIRNLEDIKMALDSGADKVAINSAALKNPIFLKEASEEVGSQAIVLSIEAKQHKDNSWEAYYDNGRERSGKNVYDWVQEATELGAGELLLTSIDKEGLKNGMDIELLSKMRGKLNIPIIISGGVGKVKHIMDIADKADGVAIASALHYKDLSICDIKSDLRKNNIFVR